MSYIENGMNINDLNILSNRLHKSSSSNIYKPLSNKNILLYNSSNIYPNNKNNSFNLPLIYNYQPSRYIDHELDLRNQRKDETLLAKKKFFKHRGLQKSDYPANDYNESWNNFFKRREKEKLKLKRYNNGNYNSESEDEIFRNFNHSKPLKLQDKLKLKEYLPIKKELTKLMMKINENMQKKVDNNSYLLNQNLNTLEQGYNELRMLVEEKMNRLELKQKQDFYNLNRYIEMRGMRNRNNSMDHLFAKNYYNDYNDNQLNNNYNNRFNNINNDFNTLKYNNNFNNDYNNMNIDDYYYKKEKYENLELAERIRNLPNLLDNMVNDLEDMKIKRKNQKLLFLRDLSKSINKELNKDRNYHNKYDISDKAEDDDYDEYENGDEVNDLKYYDYKKNLYNKGNHRYDNIYLNQLSDRNDFKNKPRTHDYDRQSRDSYLSMSKSSIQKLKKDLKPSAYQKFIQKRNYNKDDNTFISGEELLKIYQEKNENKKKDLSQINGNIYKDKDDNTKKEEEKPNESKECLENKKEENNGINNNEDNVNQSRKSSKINKLRESKIKNESKKSTESRKKTESR